MGQSTQEQLSTDIEGTRQNLGRDLDALNDKINPSRMVERRKQATRSKLSNMRDKVMGSAQHASSGISSAGGSATDRVSDAKESVSGAAQGAVNTVEQRTEGNPLAAGLIAFGAGWLVSSLIPTSEKEAQAASRVIDTAKEHGQPIMDEAKSVGQDIGHDLHDKASNAVDEVKSSAQSSAQTLKEEGQSSAQNVKGEAQSSAQNVKDTQQNG